MGGAGSRLPDWIESSTRRGPRGSFRAAYVSAIPAGLRSLTPTRSRGLSSSHSLRSQAMAASTASVRTTGLELTPPAYGDGFATRFNSTRQASNEMRCRRLVVLSDGRMRDESLSRMRCLFHTHLCGKPQMFELAHPPGQLVPTGALLVHQRSSRPVRLGPCRGRRANSVERQLDRSDADKVAVNQPRRTVETPVGKERSVLAA